MQSLNSAKISTDFAPEQTARILIVDDDIYFRQMLKTLLMAQGYEVMEARSTTEGESFLRHRPDMAIVDYRLPGTDGAVWIKTLRDRGLRFPIVFCSGSSYPSHVLTNLRNVLQVALIVRKPIAPREFVNQLQSLLPKPAAPEVPGLQAMLAQAETQQMPAAKDPNVINLATISRTDLSPVHQGKVPVFHMPDNQNAVFDSQPPADADAEPLMSDLLNQLFSDHDRAQEANNEARRDVAAAPAEAELTPEEQYAQEQIENQETEFALKELATSYLNDMPSMVMAICADLNEAEKEGQVEFLELAATHAHSMRGTAGSLGFFEISKIAAALEDRLRDVMLAEDWINRTAEVHHLVQFLNQTIMCEQSNSNTSVNAYRVIPQAMKEKPESSGVSAKPHRVMVIDDGFGESSALCLSLRDNHHCETVAITDSMKVLTLLDQYKPELLFVGMNTDGKSGYDLCRLIRLNQKWWDLPLIIMTEDCSVETRVEIYDCGATDFIARPIIESELGARLNAHLYKKQER